MKKIGLVFSLVFIIISSTKAIEISPYNVVNKIENNTATDYDGNGTIIRAYECNSVSDTWGLPIEIKPINDVSKPAFKVRKAETDYKARACSWYEAVRTYRITSTAGQDLTISLCVRKGKKAGLTIRIDKDYTALLTQCVK